MEGGGGHPHQYLRTDPLAPLPQLIQDGVDCRAADDGICTDDLLDFPPPLLDDEDLLGPKQLHADPSSGVNHLQAAAVADRPPPPVALAPSDATTIQVGFEPAADMLTTTEPDKERTLWSEEEDQELLYRLDLYTEEDAVTRCFKIAFHLPNKTVHDVALRCRSLQDDKRKTAEEAELLARKDSPCGKPIKVKGTKVAKISNKIYPLSEEALNSKSTKELIRDNNMFLKRIEENMKRGQLGSSTADYFYYVKTNMDAIKERGSKFGISMAMPPIDEEGLQEILRARRPNYSNSLV